MWQGVSNLVDCIGCKSHDTMFSISKMLRTPVLGKGRKVKHHYKAFRTVLSMMVEFNLARQVLGVKHKSRKEMSAKAIGWTVRENRSPLFITFAVSGANLYSTKRLPSATSFNDDFRYGQL